MLNQDEKIIEDLTWLFSSSGYLGEVLCHRPELLDSFVYRKQLPWSPDTEILLEQLVDYKKLREIILGTDFLRQQNLNQLMAGLSETADHIIKTLLADLIKKNPSSKLNLLTLGKWSGKELGFKSDLDFILLTPSEPDLEDHKIAKRLIRWITSHHRAGTLYSVDLRLRPSGNSGPLLTSVDRFIEFLKHDAPIWQRQAYLRSRLLFSHSQDLEKKIQSALHHRKIKQNEIDELYEIKNKLLKPEIKQCIDLKFNPGGLIDIEFALQLQLLFHHPNQSYSSFYQTISNLISETPKQQNELKLICAIYEQLRTYEQLYGLITNQSPHELQTDSPHFSQMALYLKQNTNKLSNYIMHLMQQAQELLFHLDPLRKPS